MSWSDKARRMAALARHRRGSMGRRTMSWASTRTASRRSKRGGSYVALQNKRFGSLPPSQRPRRRRRWFR